MNISVSFGELTPQQVVAILQAIGPGLNVTQGATQAAPPPPPTATAALPPPPPPSTLPPVPVAAPPPPPPAPNGDASPLLSQAMSAMEAYAKVQKAAGAKKVLLHAGVAEGKITNATPQQLEWLIQAFANTAWVP